MKRKYKTQNVIFEGFSIAGADPAQPEGRLIMQAIATGLSETNWNVTKPLRWREDEFWEIRCCRDQVKLLVLMIPSDESASGTAQAWQLQTFPLRPPGLLDRLFGLKPSATPDDIYTLAFAIHRLLRQYNATTQWCWNGDPTSLPSTTEPSPPLPEP